ncbi:MAG: long-chain-fatty-acid--CoA ligase, partial [Clostridia bacterium]|nr:long-chain-fatty-acid--CoA ligase [Clostridia bacterium]
RKEDKRFTYKMLDDRVNRLANTLLGLGLKKGDRCAIFFNNRAEWGDCYMGMGRAGIIAVPINFRLTPPEVEYIVNDSTPKAFIYEEELASVIEQIKPNVKVEHFICLGKGQGSDLDYDECLAKASAGVPDVQVNEDDIYFMPYTSGTTGFPKGVCVSNKDLVMHLLVFFKEHGQLDRRDRMLVLMPLFHSNSSWYTIGLLMVGGTAVIHHSGGFNPEEVLQVIDEEKITYSSVVPTMLVMILNQPEEIKEKYNVSTLKRFIVGSAPLHTKTKEDTIAYFKGAELFEGYGSSETGCVTVLYSEDQLRKKRSIGMAVTGKEIRLLDENGKEVPQGEVGELYSRGWGVPVTKYWNNPEATKEAFRGEWVSAGDMARVDEEGFYFLEDRKKDMIITGGENLYPTEVENIIATHPAVSEVVVIGLPDEMWGEKVHAVLTLKEGQKVSEQELKDFVKPQLAGYKRPKSYDIRAELPKSATGKIARRLIRDLYK